MTASRLYQTVAAHLLKMIESGDYPPGARLPGERELAERLGVSRVTIREAEIALEAQGWLSIRIGSGVYVRAREDSPIALPDVSAFEVTAARAVIESEAAALAASRISDAEIAELQSLIETMGKEDNEALGEEADRDFHLAIARISGNPVVAHCIRMIWRMRNELPRVQNVYARVCAHDAASRADEHDAIFEALRMRDPQRAREAMRNHFARLFESMLEATESDAVEEVRRRTQQHRERFLATTRI
ncbi:MAG: FadR family transcriptional regulator [Proteobacteria bacterium]|nr:FadR family transcriptional regulator [Pseudomonadota bacterium]